MSVPDVLYRVRNGRKNEELRYSLRSLVNVEHEQVYIVGNVPEWVQGVEHIPRGEYVTKWEALVGELLRACVALRGRQFLLMDDDFYVMAPQKVPIYHVGPLLEHAANTVGAYSRSLRATADYLLQRGVKEPLSYELHVPMLIDADAMANILRPVADKRRPALQARSLYGNLRHLKGRRIHDVKVRRGEPLPEGPLLSSNDNLTPLLPILSAAFPQAGPYERV